MCNENDMFAAAHLQRAPTSAAAIPSGSAAWLLNGGSGSGLAQSIQVTQQKLRLQSLEMERERLKLRQQEIIRQVSTAWCPLCARA